MGKNWIIFYVRIKAEGDHQKRAQMLPVSHQSIIIWKCPRANELVPAV